MGTNWNKEGAKTDAQALFNHFENRAVLFKTPFHGEFAGIVREVSIAEFKKTVHDREGVDNECRKMFKIEVLTVGQNGIKYPKFIYLDFCYRCSWEELENGHICPDNLVK